MWASVAGGSNRADAGSNAGGEAGVATAAPPAFSAPETPTPTETTDSVPPTPAAPAATPSAKPDEITFLVKVAGQPEFTGTVRSVSSERVLSLKLHAQNLYKWMWDICAREQFTLLASPDRPCTSLTPLNDLERRVGDELRRIAPEHSGDWFLVIRLHCFAAVWKPYQLPTRQAFWTLLRQARIMPDPSTMALICRNCKPLQLNYVVKSGYLDAVRLLYKETAMLPSIEASKKLKAEGYVHLWHVLDPMRPTITQAFHGWHHRVCKTLGWSECSRIAQFSKAVLAAEDATFEGPDKLLRAAPGLAPFKMVLTDEEGGTCYLLMPQYLGTLYPRPPFSPEEAAAVWRDVSSCLKALHARGFAHMDIKTINVCATPTGCEVIDHGSIERFGNHGSTTPSCIPADIPKDAWAASPALDWWMFAVLLAQKACGAHCISVRSSSPAPPKEALKALLREHCVLAAEAREELFSYLTDPPLVSRIIHLTPM